MVILSKVIYDLCHTIKYYKNGRIKSIIYHINDVPHRNDGPATFDYCENGNMAWMCYY